MNLNRDLVLGVLIGLVACHLFHHMGPANLVALSHGQKGAAS